MDASNALENSGTSSLHGLLVDIMGPAGCGKTTIGEGLAEELGVPFIDGDTLHPPSNVEKMSKGIPLTDEDRLPWLRIIRETTVEEVGKEKHIMRESIKKSSSTKPLNNAKWLRRPTIILGSSALRRRYRDVIRGIDTETEDFMQTVFLYLHCEPEVLKDRMLKRTDHFFNGIEMVESQLNTLERPTSEEPDCIWVNIDQEPENVIKEAQEKLREHLSRAKHNGIQV